MQSGVKRTVNWITIFKFWLTQWILSLSGSTSSCISSENTFTIDGMPLFETWSVLIMWQRFNRTSKTVYCQFICEPLSKSSYSFDQFHATLLQSTLWHAPLSIYYILFITSVGIEHLNQSFHDQLIYLSMYIDRRWVEPHYFSTASDIDVISNNGSSIIHEYLFIHSYEIPIESTFARENPTASLLLNENLDNLTYRCLNTG